MHHVKKYAKYYAMAGVAYAGYKYLTTTSAFNAGTSLKQAALWPGYLLGVVA